MDGVAGGHMEVSPFTLWVRSLFPLCAPVRDGAKRRSPQRDFGVSALHNCSSITWQAFAQRGCAEWCFLNMFAASSDLPPFLYPHPSTGPRPGLLPWLNVRWAYSWCHFLWKPSLQSVMVWKSQTAKVYVWFGGLKTPRELAGFRAIKQKYFFCSCSTTEKSHRWKTPFNNEKECEAWIQTGFESQFCHLFSFVAVGQATQFLWVSLYSPVKWIKKWLPKALVWTRKKYSYNVWHARNIQ